MRGGGDDFFAPPRERIGDLDGAEEFEHFLCAGDGFTRQTCKARDMNAVAAIGAARHDSVQKHNIIVPLAHAHL